FLEDESRTIGRIAIPNQWYSKMQNSELVIVEIPIEDRIQNILDDYIRKPLRQGIPKTDLLLSLRSSLIKIHKRLGGDLFRKIRDKMDKALLDPKSQKQEEWVGLLLEKYYDPLYDYQIKSKEDRSIYRSDVRGVTNYLSDLESEK
ncbi:MAG: hypothetical protein HOA19_01645, partial [Candidatus Marinimicrobia bacterium]|nr:hypothetical protein [Candidatus Neomarinimicrobiota bacterium]